MKLNGIQQGWPKMHQIQKFLHGRVGIVCADVRTNSWLRSVSVGSGIDSGVAPPEILGSGAAAGVRLLQN